MTMLHGLRNVMNVNNPDFVVTFDVFSYAIPFVSFVLDHGVKRVENSRRTEKSIWVFTKLAMIVYYLGIYVMSLEIKT